VRIRVLDRVTGKQINDSGPRGVENFAVAGNPVVAIAGTLPIVSADLPPGSYRLEVSTVDTAGPTGAVRTADVDVK
jgi:hypothetical protein